jgi:nitroreductase
MTISIDNVVVIASISIALGVAVSAAADLRIASCPMTGFASDQVHSVLNLPECELPVAYLAIGHYPEKEEDANHFPKLRLETEEIVRYVN